jgi:proteasome lid subunit RPN8/RPN11
MALKLINGLTDRIRAQAAEAYPHECCGALLGRDGDAAREILDLLPLPNQHDSSPRNRFVITSDDFRRAESAARDRGLDLVGWYHSHPDHPALPSEFDRQHAWPWYSYIIVSVEKGAANALASWRLTDDRQRFTPELVESGAKAAAP